MDFALSSSPVLGAAVLLWLVWVAPYAMRRRRASLPEGAPTLLLDERGLADGKGSVLMHEGPQRVGTAARGTGPAPRPGDPREAPEGQPASAPSSPSTPPRPFRPRWGRIAIALAGMSSLLAIPVTLVLLLVGAPGWLPLLALAVAVGCVAALRAMAVRDRRSRVNAAFKAAMHAGTPSAHPAPARRGADEVFDAGFEPEPAPKPLSRDELRAVALEVARASQASADAAAKADGETAGETWEPVQVPKPAYLGAARAERPEPAPLETPADLRPTAKTSLKPKAEAPEPGTVPGVPSLAPRPAKRPAGALGNLDAVLQRRRA
ncbi:hypothetical protein [Sinomonas halotolerans]|uniref:Uncharacterized protein n=1 Tax=Sinomonas halotolerans TaxID=1644133 RepID=A0ABU9X1Q0_9MICC